MLLHQVAFFLALVTLGNAYSKFGRTCKDIGCLDNEVCVMETKPCGYYDAQNECGQYPTCKKTTDTSAIPSCSGYVCPPSKTCQMDGTTPKCVDDLGTSGVVPLSGQSGYNPYNPSAPSAPGAPASGLYPSVTGRGQTTPRPANYRPGGYSGSGYQGGAPGSGYPGQQQQYTPSPHGSYPAGYPGSGYPGQSSYPGGYPSQGYPTGQGQYGRSGYPGSGYPGQSGYPQYPQSGSRYPTGSGSSSYPGGYQTNQYGQRYGYNSGNGLVDKITNQLKTIGLFCLILSYFTQNLYGV